MFSWRGDAHRFYLKLKSMLTSKQHIASVTELIEINEIQHFYMTLDDDILKRIYYRMIKEKNGSGIIPILVSSGPLILLVFANQLHQFLSKYGNLLFIGFVFIYIFLLTISVMLHFHEKAWAAVHIEIIQDILKERNEEVP